MNWAVFAHLLDMGGGSGAVAEPIVDPGQYARVASGRRTFPRQPQNRTSYPRQPVSDGGYPRIITPVNNEAAILNEAIVALFQDPWTVLADATSFITRFIAIVNDNGSVPASLLEYLLTEGGAIDSDAEHYISTLGPVHLLYWLNRKLIEHKATIGYTDRLSEAGWGVATPDNLTDADPLDLVATLDGMTVHALLADAQAVDDGNAASLDGPVQIGTSNDAYLIDNAVPNSGTAKNPLSMFNGEAYRYKYFGGFTSANILNLSLDEQGSSSTRRYPRATTPVIVLFKGGDPYESQDAHSRFVRNDTGSQPQNDYILWRNYPGETVTFKTGRLAATGMTGVLLSTNRERIWFDGIKFEGRYGTEGAYYFCNRLMEFQASAVDCRVMRCEFDWIKIIATGDSRATGNPGYVDRDFAAKDAAADAATFIRCQAKNLVVHACRFKPAGNELPRGGVSDEPGHGIDLVGPVGTSWDDRGATIGKCLFEGQSGHGQIRIQQPSQYVMIEDCDISNGDNSCIVGFSEAATPVGNVWIRRNRIHDWGTITGAQGDANGIQLFSMLDCIVEDNVLYGSGADDDIDNHGIVISVDRRSEDPTSLQANSDRHIVRRNVLYKVGLNLSYNGGAAGATDDRLNDNAISSNIFVDFDADRKTGVNDGPLYINLYDPIGNSLWGNTIAGNLIAYATTYDSADQIASVRTGSSTQEYVYEDGTYTSGGAAIMPGFSGNFVADPQFANTGSGNFTPALAAAAALLDMTAIPLVATPAWNS
jgi:hypothetical protein